jgi:hypothetical protein
MAVAPASPSGLRLLQLRINAELTQEEVAEWTRISAHLVSAREREEFAAAAHGQPVGLDVPGRDAGDPLSNMLP